MCSILGYLSLKDFDKVKKGFDEVTSRGPDMERYIEFSNAILGFKRLSPTTVTLLYCIYAITNGITIINATIALITLFFTLITFNNYIT